MLAIRYIALTALAVWVGGMVTLYLVATPSREALRHFEALTFVCGALVFVCLIVLKFVGPPPADFFPRVGLVVVMLAIAVYVSFMRPASMAPAMINTALGLVLLSWYVRE